MLRTKSSRFFLVLLAVFVGVAVTLFVRDASTAFHPSSVYFYTQSPVGIDIRSPTGKAIIELGLFETFSSRTDPTWRQRCSVTEPMSVARPSRISGAIWRDVYLCNAADLKGDDFATAQVYFKSRVDELFTGYYVSLASGLAFYLAIAVLLWAALLGMWRIFRWVSAGIAN
jgi:hypothetical protein